MRVAYGVSVVLAAMASGILAEPSLADENASSGKKHVLELHERVLCPDDGLLIGNGDLSVSVYQTADGIIWRFGKGDVWDRRLDLSDDPQPAHISEIAHGIEVEGWKCPPYGSGPAVATHGTKTPEPMQQLCQGSPPSYKKRPHPCPKPVGELALQLPPDQMGLQIEQRLVIKEATFLITCRWRSGVRLQIECFVPPWPSVVKVTDESANAIPCESDEYQRIAFPSQIGVTYGLEPTAIAPAQQGSSTDP